MTRSRALRPFYRDEWVDLWCGDCRDVLPRLRRGSVDLLLSDPPYGIAYERRGAGAVKANIAADGVRQGMRIVRQMLGASRGVLRPDAHAYLFCSWQSWPDFYDAASGHLLPRGALIWHKAQGGVGDTETQYAVDYEVLLHGARGQRPLAGRRDPAVLVGFPPVPAARREHPTEKPVPLLAYLIGKSCPPGGLVLDPFCGVGTALLAAKESGRRAVGVELDERYCALAARRLRQAVIPAVAASSAPTPAAQEPLFADAEAAGE